MKTKLAELPFVAIVAVIIAAGLVLTSCGKDGGESSTQASSDNGSQLPRDVPKRAAKAMQMAQAWRKDAQLISLRTQQSNNYALEFMFHSPSDRGSFYVTDAKGQLTSQAMPPVSGNTGDPIPLEFIDLPDAVAKAEQQGMPAVIKDASLEASGGTTPALAWAIQPETDHYPYLYTVDAATGGVSSTSGPFAYGTPPNLQQSNAYTPPPPIDPASAPQPTPAAEALWQKGNSYYSHNDFSNALSVYREAANAGHPRAMAVIGNLYRYGKGVTQDASEAVKWYGQAAAHGNRAAQFSLGSMYEEGEGVSKDVVKAAQLYELSARQGMPESQFALGLSYEFGQGVARNRQAAIYWLDQVAAQGDGRAGWYAEWLRRPDMPQLKDEVEFGRYTADQVARATAASLPHDSGGMTAIMESFQRAGRAAQAEMIGDNNHAAACRGNGPC